MKSFVKESLHGRSARSLLLFVFISFVTCIAEEEWFELHQGLLLPLTCVLRTESIVNCLLHYKLDSATADTCLNDTWISDNAVITIAIRL